MLQRTRVAFWAVLVPTLLVSVGCAGAPCGDPCAKPCEPCVAPCDPCAPVTQAAAAPADIPEAQPGEAWCRVWVPAEYASVAETVCTKAAGKRCVQIPPRYDVRPRLVCVAPLQLCERVQPAVYSTKKHEVMVCPEREEVRRVCCSPIQDLGPCEVQGPCYTKVVHPPVYENEDCPVCVVPERRCVQYTPAQYKIVRERYQVTPGRVQEVCEPPQFKTRVRQVMVRPGRWEWRRNVNCEVPEAPCVPGGGAAAPSDQSVAPLPAPGSQDVSVSVKDVAAGGEDTGVFGVGDTVRYDVVVESPGGSKDLQVVFTLPPELEFVEGNGGVAFEGQGQNAHTVRFDVPAGGRQTLSLFAKAVSAPESSQVEITASVLNASGDPVASATERTQVKP